MLRPEGRVRIGTVLLTRARGTALRLRRDALQLLTRIGQRASHHVSRDERVEMIVASLQHLQHVCGTQHAEGHSTVQGASGAGRAADE